MPSQFFCERKTSLKNKIVLQYKKVHNTVSCEDNYQIVNAVKRNLEDNHYYYQVIISQTFEHSTCLDDFDYHKQLCEIGLIKILIF